MRAEFKDTYPSSGDPNRLMDLNQDSPECTLNEYKYVNLLSFLSLKNN